LSTAIAKPKNCVLLSATFYANICSKMLYYLYQGIFMNYARFALSLIS